MPELPEVETTRLGILPHIQGQVIENIDVRQSKLRWPVPIAELTDICPITVQNVHRRAKYLLIETARGHILLHLGMSGRCHILKGAIPEPGKHDHIDLIFQNGTVMRYHDPRRFGAMLWLTENPYQHSLLSHLGPEPLSRNFSGKHLHYHSRGRSKTVKEFIMDQAFVVGVGNIYAQEALFAAGIHPKCAAGKVSLARYDVLVDHIKTILKKAIRKGGTSLKDFLDSAGNPGYFAQSLMVYGREGEPCLTCGSLIKNIRLGNRSSCFCGVCQR